MEKIIIVKQTDGSVGIFAMAAHKQNAEGYAFVARKIRDKYPDAEIKLVDRTAVPERHPFRDAYEWKNDAIHISHDKCCAIHMNRLRRLRAIQLAKLDIEQMDAISSNNIPLAGEVLAKKQQLRDMPTVEDLSQIETDLLPNYMPEYLDGDVFAMRFHGKNKKMDK